jgi:two-component system chemotaxis response regulator CheB
MIADDSVVVRAMVSKWLKADEAFDLVAIAGDGQQAVDMAHKHSPDVVILDIEMPRLTGLEALPLILTHRPRPRVIMASSLSSEGADVTLKALDLGAADYIAKPSSNSVGGPEGYRDELVRKIKALGRRPTFASPPRAPLTPPSPASAPAMAFARAPADAAPRPAAAAPAAARPAFPVSDRRTGLPPDVLLVASSTGGPPALKLFLENLPPAFTLPILIVQHMPGTFTGMLAAHLSKTTGRKVVEAKDGERIENGVVYIAPGGWHMCVANRDGKTVIALDQTEPENWCRPAADKLFRSAAEVYGGRSLAVVLTGMGHDGLAGAKALSEKGASILAQDEASSVVWGMPGAVAEAGLAAYVGAVPLLAAEVGRRRLR